jgi:hypothetical protein
MNEQFILFTQGSCSHCRELKQDDMVQDALHSYVREIDMTHATPQQVKLFQQSSPGNQLPALAIVQSGRLIQAAVGNNDILDILEEEYSQY